MDDETKSKEDNEIDTEEISLLTFPSMEAFFGQNTDIIFITVLTFLANVSKQLRIGRSFSLKCCLVGPSRVLYLYLDLIIVLIYTYEVPS